ncbi:MAG: hypothetical protein Q8L57_02685, partial [bacterium]|nr:hypothetical protein [bacterium]
MSEIEEEKQSAGAESPEEDAAAPEEKADIKNREESDLERLIAFLKREFRVSEEKLRVATDEEVAALIRDRWKKLGTEEIYAYLAGPIETFGDFGASWRIWLAPRLLKRKIVPLDPVRFEGYKTGFPPGESMKRLTELKKRRDWEEFRKMAGMVRYVDTNLIRRKTTLIIMHTPLKTPH